MTKWQWLSGKLWMHKWILALILIVLITDYIITKPLFQFTDAQIKIITPLVTFNSILLAAAGIMYQVQATNEREIESKIHQQKRETYVLLLEFIAKFFENMREQGTTIDPATIVSRREYIPHPAGKTSYLKHFYLSRAFWYRKGLKGSEWSYQRYRSIIWG